MCDVFKLLVIRSSASPSCTSRVAVVRMVPVIAVSASTGSFGSAAMACPYVVMLGGFTRCSQLNRRLQ